MKDLLNRLMTEEDGATIIEYVLLAALIAVVAIASITRLGQNVDSKYGTTADKVSSAGSAS